VFNKVILIGRLTKDANTSYTSNSNTQMTKFTLAVNRMNDKADFIPIVCFGKTAELTANLTKGQLIAIEGRLQIDNVRGANGWKTYVSVVANRIVFLTPKSDKLDQMLGEEIDFDEDDLPF